MPARSASSRVGMAVLALATGLCADAASRPARADFVCANCATWDEQLLQYGKEAETAVQAAQTQLNTATMLQNQVRNMASLPGSVWGSLAGDIANVQSLMQRGSQLALSAQAVSSNLSSYSSYLGTAPDYPRQYTAWSRQANDSVTATLASMGLQQNQLTSDQAVLAAVQARSASASGAVQAIQANTEMSGQTVVELQKLRQLIMTDAQMNANGMRIAADRNAVGDADMTNFLAPPAPSASGNPRY